MTRLLDWIEIFSSAEGEIVLSPAEVSRIKFDLTTANAILTDSIALNEKFAKHIDNLNEMIKKLKSVADRAIALAKERGDELLEKMR